MYKGTLVLIPFPFTDLSGQKVRPALVLHNQRGGEDCIVAFISSVQNKKIGVYDIPVVPSLSNGLKVNSTIKISKIATLQKKTILGELGQLESVTVSKVNVMLRKLFSI
ncbi:MAG: type II toxin-antitoxin system PemK/MazF family toxin [Candidatus Paceibacterota bacterium]